MTNTKYMGWKKTLQITVDVQQNYLHPEHKYGCGNVPNDTLFIFNSC